MCLTAFSGHAQILLKPVHRVHGGQVLEGFVSRPPGCTAGQANHKNHVPGTYLRNPRDKSLQIIFKREHRRCELQAPNSYGEQFAEKFRLTTIATHTQRHDPTEHPGSTAAPQGSSHTHGSCCSIAARPLVGPQLASFTHRALARGIIIHALCVLS